MTYTMTPINNGTRLRKDHNVFAVNIQSFNAGVLLEGDELWEALANGSEVFVGDKWLHVVKANGIQLPVPGWTAVSHKGVVICNNFKEVVDTPPPAAPVFPESFVLTDPNGNKAEYQFVRVLD